MRPGWTAARAGLEDGAWRCAAVLPAGAGRPRPRGAALPGLAASGSRYMVPCRRLPPGS